ncbi:MAG: RDD family protein [Bacteroidota bacterium]
MNSSNDILDYQEKSQDPELYLASQGSRLANYLLDRVGLYAFLFMFVMLTENDTFYESTESVSDTVDIVSILLLLATPFYWILSEYFLGKTPAKYITKTKVVTADGRKPSFWTIVGRTLCRFIPFDWASFLGSRAVGWHDSISKTRVVKDEFEVQEDYL